jgi:26-hydroxylase
MWKEQRRFLVERMRHFGMKHSGHGKEQLEARIMVRKAQDLDTDRDYKELPDNILISFNF